MRLDKFLKNSLIFKTRSGGEKSIEEIKEKNNFLSLMGQ